MGAIVNGNTLRVLVGRRIRSGYSWDQYLSPPMLTFFFFHLVPSFYCYFGDDLVRYLPSVNALLTSTQMSYRLFLEHF